MTGRTHDLAAFSLLSFAFIVFPPAEATLATLVVSMGAGLLGGLFPDLDKSSSDIWEKIPGGSLWGKIISPFIGGHRMISHSLVGFAITGFILQRLLFFLNQYLLVDMALVWWGFMIGYGSHLLADSVTKEGIPLLFPLALMVGFPPFKFMRIKSGGRLEKYVVYPLLLVMTGYLFLANYSRLAFFLTYNLK